MYNILKKYNTQQRKEAKARVYILKKVIFKIIFVVVK